MEIALIILASVSAGVAILALVFGVWRWLQGGPEPPVISPRTASADRGGAAATGDHATTATTGGMAAGHDITVINQGTDPELLKDVQQQLRNFNARLARVEGSADIGTNELAKAVGPNAREHVRKALELQAQNKEREAIETLLTAYDKAMTPEAKAELHNLAGNSFLMLSALQEAEGQYKQALAAAKDGGSSDNEAAALGNLALVLAERGNLAEAERMHKESLSINIEVGNERGEADNRGNLAFIEVQRGNLDVARDLLARALQIDQKLKNPRGEAATLANIAIVQRHLGEADEARTNFQKALSIRRGLQDRRGQAQVLAGLGTLHRHLGELEEAEKNYKDALEILRDVGSRSDQATQLASLGVLRALRDRMPEAITLFEEALGIYLDIGNRLGEANCRFNLGLAAVKTGDFRHGCESLAKAARMYEQSDLSSQASEVRAKIVELGCDEDSETGPPT